MVKMIKDGKTVSVADVHVPAYERMGYTRVTPAFDKPDEVAMLKAKIAVLEEEKDALRTDLDSVMDANKALAEENEALRAQVTDLTQKLSAATTKKTTKKAAEAAD